MNVAIIYSSGNATIVEYQGEDGFPYRVSVPDEVLSNVDGKTAEVSDEEISRAIPYGYSFSAQIESVTISGDDLEKVFHKFGIWTLRDTRNSANVIQAIQSALKLTYFELFDKLK